MQPNLDLILSEVTCSYSSQTSCLSQPQSDLRLHPQIRRVKCDETKPHCKLPELSLPYPDILTIRLGKRCTSTGRKCDGYQFPREQTEEAGSTSLSSPPKTYATWSQLFLPSSISRAFQGSTAERRMFHRFQVCTIPVFLGGSESEFWTSLVLKVGCEEPVVRNAIIALGTLHEDYQLRGGKYSNKLLQDPKHQHALQLYGNALRQLNQQLSEGTKTKAKLAIISSILFTCFEILRRNNMAAVIHYQAGMRELIRQLDLAQRESNPSPDPNDTTTPTLQTIPQDELNQLLRVFARYDIQACTFIKPNTERVKISLDLVPPTSFTLSEVRTHLDNLLISVYQLAKSDLAMYRYWPAESVPFEWRIRRDEGVQTFETWLAALEDYFRTAEARLSDADLKALLGMRMQVKVAIITLKTCIDSGPEATFDAFQADFEDVVGRIEHMTTKLQLPEAKPLDNESTGFTMELGIIHPLFFVALKCRDPAIRRRAIVQLKKAGREGVWEGPIVAVMAEKLMEMEEVEVDFEAGETVPEHQRFHEVKKNVDYEGGKVLIDAMRARDATWTKWESVRMAVPF